MQHTTTASVVRAGESPGSTAKPGDTAAWTDRETGVRREGFEVEFVYPATASLLIRGRFGVVVRDREIEQSRPVRMSDCAVTQRAGVR